MFISTLSLGLALLPFAAAQQIHDVQVGANGQLAFNPEAIFASPGDQVVFHFNPKNHSVIQSSFADPCGPKDGGVNSGFFPIAPGSTDQPTFSITVPDTNPIWIYCGQAAGTPTSHCGAGMVFAVNCGADGTPDSFTNFKASALAVGASLKAAASASASPSAGATPTYTAAYGGYTVPPPPAETDVTQTITLETSTWTTTYTSWAGSPDPTPNALAGDIHTVTVGGPGLLLYNPTHLAAKPRDTVVFEFHQKNHTVTQSSFADPCRRLTSNGDIAGFDSGFMPVADNATDFPTWSLTINDTSPIWAYCRQQVPSSHCGAGMVFAINSDESGPRNYAAFLTLAKMLNGTAAAAALPTATAANGAASLRASGLMAAVVAVLAALL